MSRSWSTFPTRSEPDKTQCQDWSIYIGQLILESGTMLSRALTSLTEVVFFVVSLDCSADLEERFKKSERTTPLFLAKPTE